MICLTILFLGLVWLAARDFKVTEMAGGLILQLLALIPITWFIWQHWASKINLYRLFNGRTYPFRLVHLVFILILVITFSYGLDILTLDISSSWNSQFVEEVLNAHILSADVTTGINLLTFFLAVGIAPLMEELVFRGLILQRLVMKYGSTLAIILSSLLFGILHFDAFLSATIFGTLMCLLFLKTKNLWVPLIVHWTNNAIAVGIDFWLQQKQLKTLTALDQYSWFALVLVIAFPLIIYVIRKLWPRDECSIPYADNTADGISTSS